MNPVRPFIVFVAWEIPKNMASLARPQQMQRGMAVAVGGMRHKVTWRDRGKDLRVLSLSALLLSHVLGQVMCPLSLASL